MRRFHPREREAFADGLVAGALSMVALLVALHAWGELVELVAVAVMR